MRRRLVQGGVLLSLGLVAAHASVEAWVEARAVVALEELARSLPDGASLTWARLDAEPLALALTIEDLRLGLPEGGAVRALQAGAIRLAQVGGGSDPALPSLGRAAARDLVVTLAHDAGTLRLASIEGRDVDVQALVDALQAQDPGQALLDLRVGPLVVEGARLKTPGAARAGLPRLAVGSWADRRLQGLELRGLDVTNPKGDRMAVAALDVGRLDAAPLTGDALAAAGDDPRALFQLLDRASLEGVRLEGFDFGWADGGMTLAALRLGHTGQGRIEGLALDGLGLRHANRPAGALARLEVARVDWQQVRLERLADAAARLGAEAEETTDDGGEDAQPAGPPANGVGTPEDEADPELARAFAGLELAAELVRLAVGPVRIEGVSAAGDEGRFGLARLGFEGVEAGRVGALDLAGLEIDGSEGWTVRLAAWRQGAARVGLVDLAERLESTPRTAEGLQTITAALNELPWDGSLELGGLAIARAGRTGFGIARLAALLSEDGPRRRTSLAVDEVLIDPAALGVEPNAGLEAAGIDRLMLGLRVAAVYDQSSTDLVLERLGLEASGLAGLGISVRARLGADPAVDPVTAATEAVLVRAELSFRDDGLVDRWITRMEKDLGQPRGELVRQLVADLRKGEPARSVLDTRRAAEIERFLAEPHTLVITLAPKRPLSFLALGLGALATPRQTAQSAGLEIRALNP